MSGFSAEWLDCREPVDHRSRDTGLARHLADWLAQRDAISVADLGCGTGSNLRALAPILGPVQSWTLIDNDRALLDEAVCRLASWADRLSGNDDDWQAEKAGRRIDIHLRALDLAGGLEGLAVVDLVTASALFDLVSPPAIKAVADQVAEKGAAFHTVLSFDGLQSWTPQHPADAAMLDAFLAHQRSDKGFGPAAGAEATAELAAAFAAHGYEVRMADSPWRLGTDDRRLIEMLSQGFADAVAETGTVAPEAIETWRRVPRSGAIVGHADLLALPPV
jgi:SAM-dependent methyltransferase